MNIGFLGLGKLGLPCALAIENKGHTVKGNDISESVQEMIERKEIPYQEPRAKQLIKSSEIDLVSKEELIDFSDIIFVAIQTPHEKKFEGITRLPDERKNFDYEYLKKGVRDLSKKIKEKEEEQIVVIISTVLPGTIEREIKPLLNEYVKLCYNPYFPAMGTTIEDFYNQEFTLFGVEDQEAKDKAQEFYRTIHDAPFYECSIKEAEAIKVFYNTFITTKIGFANTVMEICDKIGADADTVMNALFLDEKRIISDAYMRGGMGDGGACHPRDNVVLSWLAKENALSYDWFEHILEAREKQTEWLAEKIEEESKARDLDIVILGKAFKKNIGMTAGSPARLLGNILEEKEISYEFYDPLVSDEKRRFEEPKLFFLAMPHDIFLDMKFPERSVVIDPWRILEDESLEIIQIGSP